MKEPRNIVVPVRLKERDRDEIEKAAARENMSMSEYLRAATLMYMAISGNRYALSQIGRGMVLLVREIREKAAGMLTAMFGQPVRD